MIPCVNCGHAVSFIHEDLTSKLLEFAASVQFIMRLLLLVLVQVQVVVCRYVLPPVSHLGTYRFASQI